MSGSRPTFTEALRFWVKLGFISFGGPTGQIAIMHDEVVEKKKWITEDQFLHALNYCMILPGPEAQQLATYIGWLLHRTPGALVAGALFVLPSAVLLWLLSFIYVRFGEVPWITWIFDGLKPTVVAIVAHAVIRIGSRVLRKPVAWALAASAFIAIYFMGVPFPVIILTAGLIGLLGGRLRPATFNVLKGHGQPVSTEQDVSSDSAATGTGLGRAARILMTGVVLWASPIVAAALVLGGQHSITKEGLFFSKAAMVTFGGAYAVLPYVAQQAVERYGWLSGPSMLDGLGLAETTPGPLIMVVQFVGFVGAWNHPGELPPIVAATLGAAMTTWVTFVPCFLWILLGAPYVERMRANVSLSSALSAITAAVVGVILNLAVWFALQVFFVEPAGIQWFAICVAASAMILLIRFKVSVALLVLSGAAAGLAFHALAR